LSEAVIELKDLRKSYRTPLRQKKVEAVRGISLEVRAGEIFGFLGPNGAGKTTTIRVLMGLIKASSGSAKIFGHEVPSRAARRRLGFLPESPYFYDYLTVVELLDLTGRLFGQRRSERRRRAGGLIERVGLSHATKMPLKKFSKGMLQRAGLAQALMNDPELVVFDEPMSGLDPVGRKEVRDIIQGLRDAGKTVFFSSHILADVEMICDRVAILTKGTLHDIGTIRELVKDTLLATEVVLRSDAEDVLGALEAEVQLARRRPGELFVTLGPELDVDAYLARARDLGARLVSVTPRHETLEDVFIRSAQDRHEDAAGEKAGERP